ncbi:DUF58 domain-containing protein [Kineococcus rhizosphaerae]|uniref:Uncharacterized protein DUF58 n=1 Tax=Kineococcus rhizosphaerae TaxID=559628 RepID=A0A2T0RAK1_9ACTN|nr:DUF58 domain-containing protein [Kineococcus rhizosphaerae]PRY18183.1 uncharacterized protein DUF58 [Kineococcus rhizosphaerae]
MTERFLSELETELPGGRGLRWRPVLLATAGPALLVLSFGVGNRWLTLVGCALLAAVATAVATMPPFGRLAVAVRVPARARVGEVVEHVVRVRNTAHRSCAAVVLHLGGDGFAHVHVGVPALRAGEAVELRVPREALVRGLSAGPDVLVQAADVLGLLLHRRRARLEAPVAVHPAPTAVPVLPVPPVRVGSDDVAGLRPFRAGDRAASVHWRASARRGPLSSPAGPSLVVLEREAEPLGQLVVVLGGGEPEGFETVLGEVAALLHAERAAGRRVAVLDGAGRPAEGPRALDVLAAASPAGEAAVATALASAGRVAGRGGRVVVASAAGWSWGAAQGSSSGSSSGVSSGWGSW